MLLAHTQGEFGIVYRAKLGPRGSFAYEVAVKTLKGTPINEIIVAHVFCTTFKYLGNFDQPEVDKFVEESIKMSRFKHPHVMSLIGVCLDAGPAPYIIMPYMANGCLLDYLRRERSSLIIAEAVKDEQVMCTKLIHASSIATFMG